MTNSSNSSQNLKVVIFHGLNNNPQGFGFLKKHFEDQGYETDMVILPCHGENRFEAKNDAEALACFAESMKKLEGQRYVAVAFSHGALYLQLWMEKCSGTKPSKQVLLAPALTIRKQGFIAKVLPLIPKMVHIMSLQPKRFRRYNMLSAREYSILVDGILCWQKLRAQFRVPTKVMIDPEDELVHAQNLKSEIESLNRDVKVEYLPRPDLKHGLGAHHIIFHPDYFSESGWKEFLREIDQFFQI